MRSRYVCTSCRHVSSFALKAARRSAIVASCVQSSRNVFACVGITASSSENSAPATQRAGSLHIFFPHWSVTWRDDAQPSRRRRRVVPSLSGRCSKVTHRGGGVGVHRAEEVIGTDRYAPLPTLS